MISALLYTWAFWALYVLAMGLYRAKLAGRLGPVTYALGLPLVAVAVLVDVLAQLTLAVILFADPPREWLVTTRLQRYARTDPAGWRGRMATWICSHLLDPFDPTGDHC